VSGELNGVNTLKGGWSLVLGASSGMGRASALALAERGSNIVGVHLDTSERQAEVDGLVDELRATGVCVRFFNENAASDRARQRILSEVPEIVGSAGVKVLVHSLAFGALLPYLPEPGVEAVISPKQMDMTLSVMAHSLVYWVQDLFRGQLLRPGARVFAMTSAGTVRVAKNYGAVSAAKCALESHVRQLAAELAPHQVAVNAIRAGITLTPSFLRIPESDELSRRAETFNPHGRLTTTRDVAEAIALLAQYPTSWMTGNVVGVDGGEVLTV
jgi:enoyl-[acyl-carrier protein] reductase III